MGCSLDVLGTTRARPIVAHLEVLVEHLCGDVDAGEPAAVAGVRVVPPDRVLQPADLRQPLFGYLARNQMDEENKDKLCRRQICV